MQGTQYVSLSHSHCTLICTLLHSYSTSSLHHLPTYKTLITAFISFPFISFSLISSHFQLLRAHRDLSFSFPFLKLDRKVGR